MKKEVLLHLKEMLGLEDAELAEFYDAFMSSFGECADALRNLASPAEFMEIRRVTHTLFGFSQNVGAFDLFEKATTLNTSAKAEDAAGCATGIDAVLKLYEAYQAEP